MHAEQAIKQLLDELVRAWNSGDGHSFSRLFDEDADYVTGGGVHLAGRAAIQDALFERDANTEDSGQVTLVTKSIKALGPDAAVILCTWRMGSRHQEPVLNSATRMGLITIVALRTNEAWRIIEVHNTDTTKE